MATNDRLGAQGGAVLRKKGQNETVEPQVIDGEMLMAGVLEPKDPNGEPTDPIEFPKVTSLSLSWKNILYIDNLQTFTNLTTLRLDNNIIDKIDNLHHLENLTWLDLSFNNIEEIQGLDSLTKLTDLSLYRNRIKRVQGFDNCKSLQILSLGRNQISDVKAALPYLRGFPKLRCVCLEGNPLCSDEHYQAHLLAYLPQLKYLDYMLIDKKQAQAILDSGMQMDELTEIKEKEATAAKQDAEMERKKQVIAEAKKTFLDAAEGLFQILFEKSEPKILYALKDYTDTKGKAKEEIDTLTKELKTKIGEKNQRRLKRLSAFEAAVHQLEEESRTEAVDTLKNFKKAKKVALRNLEKEDSRAVFDEFRRRMTADIRDVEQSLSIAEIQLQELLEEEAGNFQSEISALIKDMGDISEGFWRKVEERVCQEFNKKISSSEISNEAEQYSEGQDAEGERVQVKKEDVQLACQQLLDQQNQTIPAREEEMQSAMTGWMNDYFSTLKEKQYARNRLRIQEIQQAVEECLEEINEKAEDFDDDDEEP